MKDVQAPVLPDTLLGLLDVGVKALIEAEQSPRFRVRMSASWCQPIEGGWEACVQGCVMVFVLNAPLEARLTNSDFPEHANKLNAIECLCVGDVGGAYEILNGPFYDTRMIPANRKIEPHPHPDFWGGLKLLHEDLVRFSV